MNSLKTFVHQIETFGTPLEERAFENTRVKYYRIDTVTTAVIYYNGNGKPYRATFYYN